MSESGSENGKSLSDTKPDKWFDRIYAEQDFARNIAIGAGAGAGLLMFLYWQHWLPTVLAIAMTFSMLNSWPIPGKKPANANTRGASYGSCSTISDTRNGMS